VGRIAVTAGAGVHADALAVFGRESRQSEIVQIDEAMQEIPGWIDLDRKPPFREGDLNLVRALSQTIADLGLVLMQQILDELLAGIAGNFLGRILRLKADGEMTACFNGTWA
jgi:hypothetical protein